MLPSFLLAGRVLLIFLFLGFVLQGQWTIARFFVSIFGLAACGMVAIGFKAKWSAIFLVLVLSTFNVFANNWWSVDSKHPQRDFLKWAFLPCLPFRMVLMCLVADTTSSKRFPLLVVSSSSSTWVQAASPWTKRRRHSKQWKWKLSSSEGGEKDNGGILWDSMLVGYWIGCLASFFLLCSEQVCNGTFNAQNAVAGTERKIFDSEYSTQADYFAASSIIQNHIVDKTIYQRTAYT